MNSRSNIAGLNSLKQAAEKPPYAGLRGQRRRKSAISAGASRVESALASAAIVVSQSMTTARSRCSMARAHVTTWSAGRSQAGASAVGDHRVSLPRYGRCWGAVNVSTAGRCATASAVGATSDRVQRSAVGSMTRVRSPESMIVQTRTAVPPEPRSC